MEIKTLAQFEEFLKARIPTREALFVGDLGFKRAKYFMRLLGDPQNKIKVVHVAGTSGKGSTVNLISSMLESQGKQVGLSVSPHMFNIRERFQIGNALPNEKLVLKYFNKMLPAIRKMEKTKYGSPTFFELNIALAYFMFSGEKLDYAIMETGLGGTLDATNTVTNKNKICIITKIGLDHTEILGNTIAKIASEKAGIIQNGNAVISNLSSLTSNKVIADRCKEKKTAPHFIKPEKNYSIISSTPQETVFDFKFADFSLENLKLGLIGRHQAENCSLALACLKLLSGRDKFPIDEKKLRAALEKIYIPGRCEIIKNGKQTVIVDGAHNPQKMEALTKNISKIYPKQKFIFVVAFKKNKEYKKMLDLMIPLADKILLTAFSVSGQDNHWISIDNEEIAKYLRSKNFKKFQIIGADYSTILENMGISKKPVVITGSLYLIGNIYPFMKK